MDNIRLLLSSCGATMDDIVKAVVYLRDAQDVNQVYREYFTKGQEPAPRLRLMGQRAERWQRRAAVL